MTFLKRAILLLALLPSLAFATVSTTTNKVVDLGNGSNTVFSFNFLIPAAGDEAIYITNSAGVITGPLASSLYTVSGFGSATGGTVTYPLSGPALPAGSTITIARILPLQQTTSLQNQGALLPAAIEGALDYQTMALQQVQESQNRALTAPIVDATAPAPLPAATQRANNYLAFDGAGNPVAAQPPSGGVPISSAMQPFVASASLTIARQTLGLDYGQGLSQSGNQIQIPSNSLGNNFLSFMAGLTIKGNNTSSSAQPSDIPISAILPPGMVAMFGMNSCPAGWLFPDGSTVSRTTFAGLFTAFGTLYGAGDGVSTFGLPNAQGQFVRTFDPSGAVDPGRTFGSLQADQLQDHTHALTTFPFYSPILAGATNVNEFAMKPDSGTALTLTNPTTGNHGAETRPKNIAWRLCIKT